MCVHTDGNHADTATFFTTHTHTYMKNVEEKKRKRVICAKRRSLSYAPPPPDDSCVTACVTREWQTSNKQYSMYLTFFSLDDLILFVTLYATKPCCFFTTKMLFLSVIYSITDTNNNSPEEMKRKQRNYHPNDNVIVSLD